MQKYFDKHHCNCPSGKISRILCWPYCRSNWFCCFQYRRANNVQILYNTAKQAKQQIIGNGNKKSPKNAQAVSHFNCWWEKHARSKKRMKITVYNGSQSNSDFCLAWSASCFTTSRWLSIAFYWIRCIEMCATVYLERN